MTITQSELERFHLSHPHKIPVDRMNEEEQEIYEAYQRGDLEDGPHRVTVEIRQGRRSVRWRDVVVELAGEDYAQKILSETVPQPREYLIIQ